MSGRFCMRCGRTLAVGVGVRLCKACSAASGIGHAGAPKFDADFWSAESMRNALATRSMGEVLYSFRSHPAHGHRPLPQETVASWIGVTQSQLSRLESGKNKVQTLDRLIEIARLLHIPGKLLWFDVPDEQDDTLNLTGSVLALPDGPVIAATSFHTGSAIADSMLETLVTYAAQENLAGSHSFMEILPQQLAHIELLTRNAKGRDRDRLQYVGARFHEFAAWVHQDAGNLALAMQHADSAFNF